MTDINPQYRRLAKYLNKTRKTLSQVCNELNIDIDDVDDATLDQHTQECSHCGIWGSDHRTDVDQFPVCRICFTLVGE
jgi:alpha-D-ribose 1-methylphosphonate 5-triphosphate diphosphatase PhnM